MQIDSNVKLETWKHLLWIGWGQFSLSRTLTLDSIMFAINQGKFFHLPLIGSYYVIMLLKPSAWNRLNYENDI